MLVGLHKEKLSTFINRAASFVPCLSTEFDGASSKNRSKPEDGTPLRNMLLYSEFAASFINWA